MDIGAVHVTSPKRSRTAYRGWEGFFPYYAGFPLQFAEKIISSARLPRSSLIFDPWNGSGTTTFAASEAGHRATGFDLNPVMVIVARARTLAATEADALRPICSRIVDRARADTPKDMEGDELLEWFEPTTAAAVRAIEYSLRSLLVGEHALVGGRAKLHMLSAIAATFYVALFSAVRSLTTPLRTTNPTWIKVPKIETELLAPGTDAVFAIFATNVAAMADALLHRRSELLGESFQRGATEIRNADCSVDMLPPSSVDLVLTSPPYCTRLDYARLTRPEMAILSPIVSLTYNDIKARLLGSTIAPASVDEPSINWGKTCLQFLEKVRSHPSKASKTYYYRNHVDYFSKLFSSIAHISNSLKPSAAAILVLQDSYYKEIHNPLPRIAVEMMEFHGMSFGKQHDFSVNNTMASRRQHVGKYRSSSGAIESVICLTKD